MFEIHHHQGLQALHLASADPGVGAVIRHLRAAGIDWGKIINVLITVLPLILAQNWPAVIAALLALLHPPTP